MTAQDLKNSILQLAIQGKLVEQIAEEGTAKELLEQIKAEREQLIKEKKIKKEKPLPEITEEEIPFEIPESWEWIRLDNIVKKTIKRGKSPNYTDYSSVLVFAQKCNTKFSGINMELAQYLDEISFRKYPEEEYLCDKDIVINSTGTGTMGRVGFFHESVNDKKFIIVPDSHVTLIRVISGVLPEYAYYFLKYHQPHFEKLGEGSTNQKELKADTIKSVLVPVPPIDEQRRIVAKIEELLPYVEQYDKAYSKLEVFNKKFPEDMQKSILQYAIQGKLVEQRPEEGTAEELYEQIQAEKERLIKEGKIKKEKPLSEITEEEIPFEIPDSWKWVRFRDMCSILTCGYASTPTYVSKEEGMPFISAKNIKPYNFMPEDHNYISKSLYQKLTQTCNPQLGDILLTRVGAGIGEAAIIDQDFDFAIYVSLTLVKLVNYNLLNNKYVLYWLNSPIGVLSSQSNIFGKNASQGNLNVSNVRNFLFPLPPLVEQERIVEALEKYIPYCQKLIK